MKTSVLSIFSSNRSSWSEADPFKTTAWLSCSDKNVALSALTSIIFTFNESSSAEANLKPILPPPAIIILLYGLSAFLSSLITFFMFFFAAIKNTSSPSSITVSPEGTIALFFR